MYDPPEEGFIMPARRLKEFLDQHDIKYVSISHSPTYTAQEIAASAHIPGREFAKTVMVKLNNRMAMVVLPAPDQVDFERLKEDTDAETVELADEQEFEAWFPECDVGAMPPFGNLYGVQVFVSKALTADEEITFNAGTHTELIRLAYRDFERLVKPKVVDLKRKPSLTAKILLALDGSEPSMKAAQYVANIFGGKPDVEVTLFHALSAIPPSLVEAAGIWVLTNDSNHARHRISWTEAKKAAESDFFAPVYKLLKAAGFADEQLRSKCVIESDPAHEILKESEAGGYDTIVLGKRGLSRLRTLMTGSVTEKVVRHAKGRAVWVIE
jgi:Ala-tRNA(Pro) deacylase